ncbi:hypothetical protein [Amycolatopsis taiwanensis]|uniref:hypothetical protein n=1 Tax=Amycolatopsis taiwanensis TaxID=342230 RepID=UPI0006940224|nr:hypothetical protein [Amycolatopsis taiwanensis]
MNRQAHEPSGMIAAVSGALGTVPGADTVRKAADEVLSALGRISPGSRRTAVYAGVGVLGVLGVVSWPAAAAVAGVVWLTQPRPKSSRPGDPRNGQATGDRVRASSGRAAAEPSSGR